MRRGYYPYATTATPANGKNIAKSLVNQKLNLILSQPTQAPEKLIGSLHEKVDS